MTEFKDLNLHKYILTGAIYSTLEIEISLWILIDGIVFNRQKQTYTFEMELS